MSLLHALRFGRPTIWAKRLHNSRFPAPTTPKLSPVETQSRRDRGHKPLCPLYHTEMAGRRPLVLR